MHKGGGFLLAAALAASSISGALIGAAPARAESCPGNPNALGTSRVLVVDPNEYKQVGTLQYKQTLPLADHEVVLTFDDGPLPPYSSQVLDTLISQCVKATYFIVGEMARAYPDMLRREYEAGYTIGTHSQNHPTRFENLTGDKLSAQIDGGIASVSAVLGDPDAVAPFFRIPGLGRSEVIEEALAARGLAVFSIDTDADDWFRHVSAAQVVEKSMSRLEKLGRGILLLHDIHPWTAEALPELLRQLKEHGFHVVNIVPPTPQAVAMANATKPWIFASAAPDAVMIADGATPPNWPQPSASDGADDIALAAPDPATFDVDYPAPIDGSPADENAAGPQWSSPSERLLPVSVAELPAPGLQDLGVSLRGRRLVGADLERRPSVDVPAAPVHERLRHVRLHAHHPAFRHARVSIEGQHVDAPDWSYSAASTTAPSEY
ncbi:MAG: polysaccharide deacetylase family protein [Xanthobacteraceae bacterium]